MEDEQNAQQQPQEQNPEGWRDGVPSHGIESDRWSVTDIKRQKILGFHEHSKYCLECVRRKKKVLGDLRSFFAKKCENEKDRLGGVRRVGFKKKVILKSCRPSTIKKLQGSDEVSDLVTAIQSPHFKITEKGNLNKTNGLLSAGKTDTLTNGPLVREVENGSILCDSHQVSDSVNHTVLIMEGSEQTLSMGQM